VVCSRSCRRANLFLYLHGYKEHLLFGVGPLTAVIQAQAASALTTIDFIKSVGMDSNGSIINVEFIYNITNATSGQRQANSLKVPLLTIVPIPFINVDECTITFNAKLTSVTLRSTDTDTSLGVEASGGGTFGPVTAEFKAKFSTQLTTSDSNKEEREFSMKIFVRAVQDEMPSGLARILSILEQAVLIDVRSQIAASE
jgi:hypothetical protein